MEGFVFIVSVIFGILSLVLFFKIWGACNDIAEIRRLMSRGNTQRFYTSDNPANQTSEYQYNNSVDSQIESSLNLKIAELEAVLSNIPSVDDKYSKLNQFLNKEYKHLKKYTLKGSEGQANKTWQYILNGVTPLCKSIGYSIPDEYNTGF